MKLVVVSDLHLDTVTDGVHRGPEVARGVDVAIAEAEAMVDDGEQVGFIFAGDLSDPLSTKSVWAVARACGFAARLQAKGIQQLWITGNHDVMEDGSGHHVLMSIAEGFDVTVADQPEVVDMHGVKIMALPFASLATDYDPDEAIAELEVTPDIIVGHLNLDGITGGSESTEYARGRNVFWPLVAIEERCPTALLLGGHYHERQVYDGVQIIGSMARLTHGEADMEPGYLVVDV